MRKEKTVEVTACDFCPAENVSVWTCGKCKKEACATCTTVYSVTSRSPVSSVTVNGTLSSSSFMLHGADFSFIVCKECKTAFEQELVAAGMNTSAHDEIGKERGQVFNAA